MRSLRRSPCSVGSSTRSAPNSRASSFLASTISRAVMCRAPPIRRNWIAESPMGPAPDTTMLSPSRKADWMIPR